MLDAGGSLDSLGKGESTALYELLAQKRFLRPTSSFETKRDCIPGPRTECLNILSQRLGPDFLNQSIDHGSDGRVYTPLSLAAVERDWEIFQALHNLGASFETNALLDDYLDQALHDLQLPAAMILVKNGARVPPGEGGPESSATRHEWIRKIYIFSQDHEISYDDIYRFREIMGMLISQDSISMRLALMDIHFCIMLSGGDRLSLLSASWKLEPTLFWKANPG